MNVAHDLPAPADMNERKPRAAGPSLLKSAANTGKLGKHQPRKHPVKRLIIVAMTALLLSAGATRAGPLEDGVAAQNRGDYTNALRIYRSLATQGRATAQLTSV